MSFATAQESQARGCKRYLKMALNYNIPISLLFILEVRGPPPHQNVPFPALLLLVRFPAVSYRARLLSIKKNYRENSKVS